MKRIPGRLRIGLIVAATVCALIAVIQLAVEPMYARGVGQGWASHVNGVGNLLALPGFVAAVVLGVRTGHHTTPGAFVAILVLNFAFYTLVVAAASAVWQAAARRIRSRRRTAHTPSPGTPGEGGGEGSSAPLISNPLPHPPPAYRGRGLSRRRLIGAGAGLLAAAAVGYPLGVATRQFEITRRTFGVRGLPAELNGLRIVQVTDVHHGPWIPLDHVRGVVTAVNALQPDLVLLTGDYVHRSPVYIDPVVGALADLRASVGVLGVLGNHDWWEDPTADVTRRAFSRAGIPLIDNARRFVTPERTLVGDGVPDVGLCVAGVGDYYEDLLDFDAALGGVPTSMPRLLMSHNPDVAEDRAFRRASPRVDLMLSGHTHGGQIYVPGLGTPIVPSRYGQKYARGLIQGPICPVFVCRGVGHTVMPVRVGIRPEVAVIELRGA